MIHIEFTEDDMKALSHERKDNREGNYALRIISCSGNSCLPVNAE